MRQRGKQRDCYGRGDAEGRQGCSAAGREGRDGPGCPMRVGMVEKPWGDPCPLGTRQFLVLTPVSLETFGVKEADGAIQVDFFHFFLNEAVLISAFLPSTLIAVLAGLST